MWQLLSERARLSACADSQPVPPCLLHVRVPGAQVETRCLTVTQRGPDRGRVGLGVWKELLQEHPQAQRVRSGQAGGLAAGVGCPRLSAGAARAAASAVGQEVAVSTRGSLLPVVSAAAGRPLPVRHQICKNSTCHTWGSPTWAWRPGPSPVPRPFPAWENAFPCVDATLGGANVGPLCTVRDF